MKNNLIDSCLFTDGIEPWPNQVFYKNFDAYFLLDYPAYQYNPNEENIFDPFDLLNNLQEKNIFISETSDKYNLTHAMNADWNRQIYYDAYKQNIVEERFLFWESDGDRWAMVSDAKYKVALIGIDWKSAYHIPMLFNNCLLSPIQFLAAVGMQKHLDIFMKNYQPSSLLTEGSEKNPIWKKYYFQCHVNNENDKLFYWKQFEQLHNATSKLLSFCKGLDLYADQAFQRRYWQNKMWYSSYSQAPVGGYQNYNLKNCEKVATKFLTENEHLQLDFEGEKEKADALYIANKKGLVNFFGFHIYGNLEKQKTKGGYADFNFGTCLHCHSNKSVEHNQNFEFHFREIFLNADDVQIYIMALKEFCFIKKVHEVRMPSTIVIYTKDKPLEVIGIYSFVPEEVTKSHPLYNRNQE